MRVCVRVCMCVRDMGLWVSARDGPPLNERLCASRYVVLQRAAGRATGPMLSCADMGRDQGRHKQENQGKGGLIDDLNLAGEGGVLFRWVKSWGCGARSGGI